MYEMIGRASALWNTDTQASGRMARRGDRKARILDAARHAFLRKGFQGASMRDICNEADMSPGNVYRYFPSKNAIVAATVERECTSTPFLPQDSKGPLAEDLAAAIMAGIRTMPERNLVPEMLSEALRNADVRRVLARNEEVERHGLAGAIRAAQRRGEIDASVDPTLVIPILFALRDGMALGVSFSHLDDTVRLEHVLRSVLASLIMVRPGVRASDPRDRIRLEAKA